MDYTMLEHHPSFYDNIDSGFNERKVDYY